MKKIFPTLLLILTFLTGFIAESQNLERFPRIHERIIQAKLHEIGLQLNLDRTTFNLFRPVYLRYEREISGIDFKDLGRLMRVDADNLTAEEADQLIVDQMEMSKKQIDIRQKYYLEFRKVISPQKIIKLYQTEAEIRKKVMLEMKRRMNNR